MRFITDLEAAQLKAAGVRVTVENRDYAIRIANIWRNVRVSSHDTTSHGCGRFFDGVIEDACPFTGNVFVRVRNSGECVTCGEKAAWQKTNPLEGELVRTTLNNLFATEDRDHYTCGLWEVCE